MAAFGGDVVMPQTSKRSKFTITETTLNPPSQTTSLCGGVFEMESEFLNETTDKKNRTKFEVNRAAGDFVFDEPSTPDETLKPRKSECQVCRASNDDVFTSPNLKLFNSPESHSTSSPDSSSPVLTLASSVKDASSVSRGFVVPDASKQSPSMQ